jgi:hypothetical protein
MPHNAQLSVVLVICSDTTDAELDLSILEGNLAALHAQVSPPTLEIIVPYAAPTRGIEELQKNYPDVLFMPVSDLATYQGAGSREHHDELRARGLAEARGQVVALLEDHGYPDPHWSRNMWAEQQREFAAVGGAIENDIDRPLNWAVYFCDFFRYQNPVPAGENRLASDVNVSYKRAALNSLRPLLYPCFRETTVNQALVDRGHRILLSPAVIVRQTRTNLRMGGALRERFIWGRSYAGGRSREIGEKRLLLGMLCPILPAILVLRIARTVFERRRLVGPFLKALPLLIPLMTSWSLGELVGYFTARPAVEKPARRQALVNS